MSDEKDIDGLEAIYRAIEAQEMLINFPTITNRDEIMKKNLARMIKARRSLEFYQRQYLLTVFCNNGMEANE